MAELTGLESILSKSHYKTDRRNKFSFGKSHRFSSTKSRQASIDPAIQSTISTSPRLGIPEPVPLATAKSISSTHRLTTLQDCSTTCLNKNGQAFPSELAEMYPNSKSDNPGRRLSQQTFHRQKSSQQQSTSSTIQYQPNFESISKFTNSSKYSIRKKNPSDSFIKYNQNPEPSKYNLSLEKEGRVTVSNFKSPKKAMFPKSARFVQDLQNALIGPGKYEGKEENSSRHQSSKKNIFTRAARATFTMEMMKLGKDKSPGPVYYIP